MSFNPDNEPCGRCLIHLNASGYIRAIIVTDGQRDMESCPSSTMLDPRELREWLKERIARGAWFEMNAWSHAIVPISTWLGDLVCQIHLWQAVEREMKPGVYRR